MIENLTMILMIATRVAGIPYDAVNFNCWDESTLLHERLAEYGIPSRLVTGVAFGGAHTWLSVGDSQREQNNTWIETVKGTVITNRSLYRMGYYSPPKNNPFVKKWFDAHPLTITIGN